MSASRFARSRRHSHSPPPARLPMERLWQSLRGPAATRRGVVGIGRRLKLLLAFVFLIGMAGYLLIYLLNPDDVIEEAVMSLAGSFDRNRILLAEICSMKTNTCYSVIDSIINTTFVKRSYFVRGYEGQADTEALLIPPEGLDATVSDTRMWHIDESRVLAQYVAMMAAVPFMTSSLSFDDSKRPGSLLIIGLGGGVVNAFIHRHLPQVMITIVELDPVIAEIAKRWFHFREEKNQRCVIGDGVDFIREAAKNGFTYDVVMIDACENDPHDPLPCPAVAFRDDAIVQNMKQLLNVLGVLIVNILPMNAESEALNKTLNVFRDIFPQCFAITFPNEVNVLLVCLPYRVASARETVALYKSRLRDFRAKYHMGALLDLLEISS